MSVRNLQVCSAKQAAFWTQFDAMRQQQRVAQALLLIVPASLHTQPLLDRILTSLLCTVPEGPCGVCSTCLKILQDTHPDIQWIQPEAAEGQIKIEQIRTLQQSVYQTPQLGARQLVIIQPVDGLNTAAASALLKILEEPPPSTLFVLLTTQPNLLLPTLWSRCQPYRIPDEVEQLDYLSLGKAYPELSVRATLFAQRVTMLTELDTMLDGKLSPCSIAERWSNYPLYDVLWFLYALIAKCIDLCLRGDTLLEAEYRDLHLFSKKWRPEHLFLRLEAIQQMMANLQRNINLNETLALERVLIDLVICCDGQSLLAHS